MSQSQEPLLTPVQIDELEKYFNIYDHYLDYKTRETLARRTGLNQKQIVVWFMDRRAKETFNPSYNLNLVYSKAPEFDRYFMDALPSAPEGPPVLTQAQINMLESYFNLTIYPDNDRRDTLKLLTGLSMQQIENWFKDRRREESRKIQEKISEVEKRATEERTNALIEELQQENLELKEELRRLKEEHEETLSKLKKSEDVATLERNLVQLAQGVLNLKVSTEKKFKKLEKKVEKSSRDQKGAELQKEFSRKLKEKDEEIEKHKNRITRLKEQVIKQTRDEYENHLKHDREIRQLYDRIAALKVLEKTVEEKNTQSKDEQSAKSAQMLHKVIQRKPSLNRLVMTKAQTDVLERVFNNVSNVSRDLQVNQREILARETGLAEKQVNKWFGRRRSIQHRLLQKLNEKIVELEVSNQMIQKRIGELKGIREHDWGNVAGDFNVTRVNFSTFLA